MNHVRYLALPMLLALTGCSLFAGSPVPPQPPLPALAALASGTTPKAMRFMIERDAKNDVAGFKPLMEARAAVHRAAQSQAVTGQAGADLDKATQALARADKAWGNIAAAPKQHPRALAVVMHESRLALGWAHIALAKAGRETGLHKLVGTQHALQRKRQRQQQQTHKPAQINPRLRPREPAANALIGTQLVPGRLGRIRFAVGTANLTSTSRPVVKQLAAFLHKHDDLGLVIAGYTDNTAPSAAHLTQFLQAHADKVSPKQPRSVQAAAYNLWMSGQRAQAVKQALLEQGLDASRIAVRAFGQTHPVASNTTAQGRSNNRRVVVTVVRLPGQSG